jgi:hypothetical protein
MLVKNEQCKTFELASIGNISCVWVETESPGCKTKQEFCDNISNSKEWCETEGSVFGESLCIWIEENINNDEGAKCMNKVLYLFNHWKPHVFFYYLFTFRKN